MLLIPFKLPSVGPVTSEDSEVFEAFEGSPAQPLQQCSWVGHTSSYAATDRGKAVHTYEI